MTSFLLRLIAVIAMLIDHTAYVLVDPNSDLCLFMRAIGRIAFPIFCFLVVEGFEHTRSVRKYIGRMALFALIAEIPFDLAFHREFIGFDEGQNVFVTLLLGLCAITAAGKGVPALMNKFLPDFEYTEKRWFQVIAASPVILLCYCLAELLSTDYGGFGVIGICLFFLLRSNRALAIIAFCLYNSINYGIMLAPNGSSSPFPYTLHFLPAVQWFASFAALPLGFYNGQPGERRFRHWFYIFYPAHLLILWIISNIV